MASEAGTTGHGELVIQVETVAGLDGELFCLYGESKFVIAGGGVGPIGGVAEDVLVAEFLVDGGVDFVEWFFFGGFEEASARGFCELLQNFFAVGA